MEESFAIESEGKLFVNIYLLKTDEKYTVTKDYYTVKNGNVFLVNDGEEEFTEDTLFSLKHRCKMIGKYEPKNVYKKVVRNFSYPELKNLLKL